MTLIKEFRTPKTNKMVQILMKILKIKKMNFYKIFFKILKMVQNKMKVMIMNKIVHHKNLAMFQF